MIKQIPRPADADRTPDGLPKMEPETEWPGNWANVNAGPGTQPMTTKIEQRNTKNESLPWLIGAWVTASVALTLAAVGWLIGPRLIRAEVRAEFAQEIADTKAEARQAGTDAAIAKNSVQKLEARISERR